jgi:DnaJ-class molecular chaperone
VFGTASPFAAQFSYNTTDAVSSSPPPAKPPCQELKLFLSLEEIYRGCTKKVKVARKRLSTPAAVSPSSAASPASFLIDERLLSVEVRPGWKAGTRITFPGEGDESEAAVRGDVAFILCDRPHPRFRRAGSDLVYLQRLRLVISVGLTEVCSPKGRKVVRGEGMVAPETGQAGQQAAKGDLIFEYEIDFPEQLTLQQKEALRKILP